MGKAVPERKVSNDDLSNWVDTSDEWIRSHTGIESRYLVSEGESCSSLAIRAGRQAMENASVTADQIAWSSWPPRPPIIRPFPPQPVWYRKPSS